MMDELESESPPFRRDISIFKISIKNGKLYCGRIVYNQGFIRVGEFPYVTQSYFRPVAVFIKDELDSLEAFIDTKLPGIAYCEDIARQERFDPSELGLGALKWLNMPYALVCWHPENFGFLYVYYPGKAAGTSLEIKLHKRYKTREWLELVFASIQKAGLNDVYFGELDDDPFQPDKEREPCEILLVKPAATLKKKPGKTFQDRLWNAGYYRYLRARDAERIFAEAKASDPEALRLPSVGRQYFGDSEEIAESGLEPFFQIAWDFLKLQKVKPPLLSSLNPPEFEHGGPDEEAASAWALQFLNKRLEQVGSPERAYAVNDGNDLNIIFLTPAQYRLIRSHPDYDPIGDPHPL